MSICENCKSIYRCTVTDKNKEACWFFSPTEDYRIKNSKEYAIGYEQGRADEQLESIEDAKMRAKETLMAIEEARKDEREKTLDEVELELFAKGFIFTEYALEVWKGIKEQLKDSDK